MKRAFFSILYWLCWPLIWLYVPFRKSARILVVKDNTYLVIKPYFGNGHWQLPGGGIKRGESAAHAAQRELKEELGIDVQTPKRLLPDSHYKEKGMYLRYEIYVAHYNEGHIKLNHELVTYTWLPAIEAAHALPHVQQAIATFVEGNLVQ